MSTRSLVELATAASPNGVVVVDADRTIRFANPAFARQFGCAERDVIGRPLDDFAPGATGTPVDTPEGRYFVVWFEERLEFKRLVMNLSASFVNLEADKIDAAIVDAQRRIVEALDLDRSTLFQWHDDEQEFVRTHGWSRDASVFVERGSPARLFPTSFARVARGECVAFTSLDEIDPSDREAIRAFGTKSGIALPLTIGGRVAGAITFGSLRHEREWSETLRDRLQLIVQVFAQALARKRAEAALQATEQRFRTLADQAPVMIWTSGPDKRCTWVNRRWCDFTGRPLEEQLGSGWAQHIHPDDLATMIGALSRAVDARATFAMHYRVKRYDGVYRWIFDTGAPAYSSDGSFIGYLGTAVDVTAEREAKLRLESAIADLEVAYDNLGAQFERLELVHRITRAVIGREDVGSMFRIVLHTLEDQLGCNIACICESDDSTHSIAITHVASADVSASAADTLTAQPRIDVAGTALADVPAGDVLYEPGLASPAASFPAAFGATGLASWAAVPLRAGDRVLGLLVVGRRGVDAFSAGDREFLARLSEHVGVAAHQTQLYSALQRAYDDLRHTQHALVDQERLHVLGQMASGIAHDINNALGPVSLYATTIRKTEPHLSASAHEYLDIIERSVRDVAQTVDRLRAFSRRRDAAFSPTLVDVHDVVEQVTTITRARWKDIPLQRGIVVQLRTDLAESRPAIVGDEAEIRGALVNLVFNAIDAMPAGGVLTLATRVRDGHVRIEVSDTGVGMSDEVRRRCLEPFFTTKGDRGTGLGLAMVYGAVQRHGAELDVQSAPGAGTTIALTFTAAATVAGQPPRAAEATANLPALRVLVIDDDMRLLKSLRDVLEHEGHSVAVAQDGRGGLDAFRAAQESGSTFDVVLTDLAMPDVDGRKVAAGVKRMSSETPVILLTGWGQQLIADEIPPYVDRVLCKPPRAFDIREALAGCCART
jgi:PAS domain S-box-containing protein